MTRLHYIGDGLAYIHEDFAAGIPPMPPVDFDTDNPVAIAVALESGLYEEATKAEAKEADAKEAKKEAKAKADEPPVVEPVGHFPPVTTE